MESQTNEVCLDRSWWVKTLLQAAVCLSVGAVLIALVGLAQRQGWIMVAGSSGAVSTDDGGDVEYTCPMHPQIRQPTPGRCPICAMELVPAGATGSGQEDYAVHVETAARRLADIQTAPAQRLPLTRSINTVGMIRVDESRQATIAAYAAGRIERMFADYTGVAVNEGDHLVVLYSPELYSAQAEFVETRRTLAEVSSGGLPAVVRSQRRLVDGTRRRLIELGMTEEQVKQLEQTNTPQARLTIYAPIPGTVLRKQGIRGEYINTGDVLYEIANLETVWLMLELFPEDAARVRFGQRVEAHLPSLPGQEVIGRVAFIDPTVDPKTRTVGVRVELLNLDGKLRPGDYATAEIDIPLGASGEVFDAALAGKWVSPMHPQIIRDGPGKCPICDMDLVPTSRYGYADTPRPQPEVLAVPRSAVLKVGGASVVYVETEPGRFAARTVKLGPVTDTHAAILDGLEPGDDVATAGNFLLDSQAQLQSKPSLLDPTRAVAPKKEGPLDPGPVQVQTLPGDAGEAVEQLYTAYLDLQGGFAADRPASAGQTEALSAAARGVLAQGGMPEDLRPMVEIVRDQAAHLHHPTFDQARQRFKTISHAMIKLAARIRGGGAHKPLLQMYCPMVQGGGGDWLQSSEPLANPYYGSQMLRCGELVRTLPAAGHGRQE